MIQLLPEKQLSFLSTEISIYSGHFISETHLNLYRPLFWSL